MGEITAEILNGDYKKEGDLLTPHKLTNKFAGQEIEILVQSMEFDAALPKDRFDLPGEIQALLKKADQPAPKAAAAPAQSAAGENGKFAIYMGGKPTASENYTVHKAAGKVEVSGSGNAAIGTL